MGEPMTAKGREAVRLRGLFGGETEARCNGWVAAIEAEAVAAILRELRDEVARMERDLRTDPSDPDPDEVLAAVLAAIDRRLGD